MSTKDSQVLTELSLSGFKSISTKQSIRLGPLTLLSGANSSGKSSVTQALLLLKQTFEAPYDPGALLLNGPNVRMTSADQALTLTRKSFSVGLAFSDNYTYETFFRREQSAPSGVELDRVKISWKSKVFELSQKSTSEEIKTVYTEVEKTSSPWGYFSKSGTELRAKLERNRCDFDVKFYKQDAKTKDEEDYFFSTSLPDAHRVRITLLGLLHVPGLRGNPERTYTTTAVGKKFPDASKLMLQASSNTGKRLIHQNLKS